MTRDALAVEDPWEGFLAFLHNAIERQTRDRGLKELMHGSAHGHAQIARARDQLVPLVTELVERAQGAGQLRDDFAPSDFPLIQFALGAVADYTADVEPEAWRRIMGLLIDGMRVRRDAPTPLEIRALDTDEIECAMRDWRPRRR